jgi:hypothetical protein
MHFHARGCLLPGPVGASDSVDYAWGHRGRGSSLTGAGHDGVPPCAAGDGWWSLVPIWESPQTPNPLRRWELRVPYWANDS